jgi:hypothetical protein
MVGGVAEDAELRVLAKPLTELIRFLILGQVDECFDACLDKSLCKGSCSVEELARDVHRVMLSIAGMRSSQ